MDYLYNSFGAEKIRAFISAGLFTVRRLLNSLWFSGHGSLYTYIRKYYRWLCLEMSSLRHDLEDIAIRTFKNSMIKISDSDSCEGTSLGTCRSW